MSTQAATVSTKKLNKSVWIEHIKQWKLSGLSQEACCAQNGIRFNTFVYWRGQYLIETGESKSKQFI